MAQIVGIDTSSLVQSHFGDKPRGLVEQTVCRCRPPIVDKRLDEGELPSAVRGAWEDEMVIVISKLTKNSVRRKIDTYFER